jgi:hypothetical protein
MRLRPAAIVLIVVVLALGAARIAGAQGSDSDTVHPLVGTWLFDTDVDDPENPPEVDIFTADGGVISVDATGETILGVWEATGDTTASATLVSPGAEEETYFGTLMIRADIEVADDGDTLDLTYTFDFSDPDGNSPGEYGLGHASGTRINAESPGTPVGTIEDLFKSFGGEATPES